jgi:ketosteroid isomerase-like protein
LASPTTGWSSASTPEELHAVIADAFNRADVEAFLDAHEDNATVLVPPNGRPARGRDDMRTAVSPLFALAPDMTMVVVRKLETDGLVLTRGRWSLTVSEDGHRSELSGLGSMVCRRGSDGVWRIVLDDPLAGL